MKTAAILGASADPTKFGHKAVLAYALQGYTVWPVNPKESHIAGHPAYRDIASLPGRPEVISAYLPPLFCSEFCPSLPKGAVTNSGLIPAPIVWRSSQRLSAWVCR